MTIKTTVTTITPAEATKLLALSNYDNRNISEPKVIEYTRLMAENLWLFNGDTICFSDKGRLMDGQHRLTACVRSGVPLKAVLVQGLPDEAYTTIDRGKLKSHGDMFKAAGHRYATKLAAAAKWAYYITAGRAAIFAHNQPHHRLSVAEALSVVDEFPALKEATAKWFSGSRTSKALLRASLGGGGRGHLVALHALVMERMPDEAEEFFERRFGNGIGITSDKDPAFVLRDKYARFHASDSARLTPHRSLWYAVRAWNAHCKDEQVSKLSIQYFAAERFPNIIGGPEW